MEIHNPKEFTIKIEGMACGHCTARVEKALKEIEEKLNTVQMYLENNYKDLTLQSYKDAKEVVERYEKSGLLKQKDKDMIQKKMAEFDAKLVHYGHTNVSEFLKERY